MKRFIVIFTLFIISLMTPCENLNGTTKVVPTEMADKYKVYCEITYMPYQRVAIVNIGSTIDAIRDKDGKPKEFISIMEAINYMAKFGWEITEIYGIPNGTDKNTYYFLCKEVSNESELNHSGLQVQRFLRYHGNEISYSNIHESSPLGMSR